MSFAERLQQLTKPDIILIITDQERAIQHFPEGWAEANLPSMNRLKQNGFSFERAFCNSCMCSPSRATLFTGTYPAQHQVTQTLTFGGKFSEAEIELDNKLPNLARMLIGHGYDVQYRGKWHLSKGAGENGLVASDLAMYGFRGWQAPDAGEDTKPENFGGGFANHDAEYVRQAIDYLDGVRQRRANPALPRVPYCLVLSLVNPHDVLCYPKDFDYGYTDEFLKGDIRLPETVNEDLLRNKKPMAQAQTLLSANKLLDPLPNDLEKHRYLNLYGNLMKLVDAEIGVFLDALYQKDNYGSTLADDAVVFRLADHGEMGLAHGGMRQKAFVAYEEVLRIPMVVSNPRLFPAPDPNQPPQGPRSSQNLASLIDVLPTIAALTGAPAPEGLRGVDLTPVLAQDEPVQDAVLFTFDDTKASANNVSSAVKAANRLRCIRTTEWKYVHYFHALGAYPDEYELYDLRDPNATEYENLAYDPAFQDKRQELAQQLQELTRQKLLRNPALSAAGAAYHDLAAPIKPAAAEALARQTASAAAAPESTLPDLDRR